MRKYIVAGLLALVATLVFSETDPIAMKAIKDIQKGNPGKNEIRTLYVSGSADIDGAVTAGSISGPVSGDGSSITNLNGANIASGNIAGARLVSGLNTATAGAVNPGTNWAVNAARLVAGSTASAINGSAITGVVASSMSAAGLTAGTSASAIDGSAITNLNAANVSGTHSALTVSGAANLQGTIYGTSQQDGSAITNTEVLSTSDLSGQLVWKVYGQAAENPQTNTLDKPTYAGQLLILQNVGSNGITLASGDSLNTEVTINGTSGVVTLVSDSTNRWYRIAVQN